MTCLSPSADSPDCKTEPLARDDACQGSISPIVVGILLAPFLLLGLGYLLTDITATYVAMFSFGWSGVALGVGWPIGFAVLVWWMNRRGMLGP